MKIQIHKHHTEGWRWWYIAFGNWHPFKRFGHSGWICLNLRWMGRFWNHDGPRPECDGKQSA